MLKGHTGWVRTACFSPDGARLASASDDRTARVWDTRTGRELLVVRGHTSAVYAVGFSPDGTRLATGSEDRTARVWDARTGQELLTLTGHAEKVYSVRFSPDGARLTTVSWDGERRLWDARTGQLLPGPHDPRSQEEHVGRDAERDALPWGNTIRLVDRRLSDDELARRRWATRRDPLWHADEAQRLRLNGQPGAAAYHAALFRGLHAGAAADLRLGLVLARSGRYPDALLALLRSALYAPEDDGASP